MVQCLGRPSTDIAGLIFLGKSLRQTRLVKPPFLMLPKSDPQIEYAPGLEVSRVEGRRARKIYEVVSGRYMQDRNLYRGLAFLRFLAGIASEDDPNGHRSRLVSDIISVAPKLS